MTFTNNLIRQLPERYQDDLYKHLTNDTFELIGVEGDSLNTDLKTINYWRIFLNRNSIEYIQKDGKLYCSLTSLFTFHILQKLLYTIKDFVQIEDIAKILQGGIEYNFEYESTEDREKFDRQISNTKSETHKVLRFLIQNYLERDEILPEDQELFDSAVEKFQQGDFDKMSEEELYEFNLHYHEFFYIDFTALEKAVKEGLISQELYDIVFYFTFMKILRQQTILINTMLNAMIHGDIIYLVIDNSQGVNVSICRYKDLNEVLTECSLVVNINALRANLVENHTEVKKTLTQTMPSIPIDESIVTIDQFLQDIEEELKIIDPDKIELQITAKSYNLDNFGYIKQSLPYRGVELGQNRGIVTDVKGETKKKLRLRKKKL